MSGLQNWSGVKPTGARGKRDEGQTVHRGSRAAEVKSAKRSAAAQEPDQNLPRRALGGAGPDKGGRRCPARCDRWCDGEPALRRKKDRARPGSPRPQALCCSSSVEKLVCRPFHRHRRSDLNILPSHPCSNRPDHTLIRSAVFRSPEIFRLTLQLLTRQM